MEEFMDEFATNLGELSRGFSESFERYVFPPLLLCTDSANQYSAMGSTDPEEFYLVEKEIEMTWYAVSVSYFRSTNGIFEAIGNLSTGFSEYLLKKTEAEKNRERVKEMKEEEGDKEEDSHPYKDNIWYLPSSHQLYKNEPSKFPSLNVLILLVGSRGDIQPFVALAHGLREAGHNIRFVPTTFYLFFLFKHSTISADLERMKCSKILLKITDLNLFRLVVILES